MRAVAIALATAVCSDGPTTPAPTPPADLRIASVTPATIVIEWTYPVATIDEFSVERRTVTAGGTSEFSEIATVSADARSYTDPGLAQGTRYEYRVLACRSGSCSDPSPPATGITDVVGRSTANRADDITGPQVGVFYVIPSDGTDHLLDVNDVLARSVASFRNWFVQKSGLDFRFDTHQGAIDVGFFRLSKTDAEMKGHDPAVVSEIERQLRAAGRLIDGRIYIVYYGGGSNYACGGAAWPPNVPGQVAAMYLRGTPGNGSCGAQGFVASPTSFPGYWEFAALHDLVHTLGIVSTAAPHHQNGWPAHVPEGNDLMFSGTGSWQIGTQLTIDVGGDDYFGGSVPAGLPTLNSSPFTVAVTTPLVAARRGAFPARSEADALEAALSRLPMHPAFRTPHPD